MKRQLQLTECGFNKICSTKSTLLKKDDINIIKTTFDFDKIMWNILDILKEHHILKRIILSYYYSDYTNDF